MSEFLTSWTRASKLLRGAADDAMSRHGVRVGQNMLLEVLWESDGLTPGELAGRLSLATPTVVKSARRMESAGLLTRKVDDNDGRLVRLHLTPRALSIRDAIERERALLAERAMGSLSAPERRVLLRALGNIIEEFGSPRKAS